MKIFKKTLILASILFTVIGTGSLWAEVYMNDAVVSYYAEDFHGKKTSNGETFNMYDLTCANKSLPFDTKLKVTNLSNGKSVVVRVNDRGPFVLDRELDLSKAAAVKLDMIKQGTTHVKIEIVQRGPDTKLSRETAEKAMQIANKKAGKTTVTAATTAKTAPANSSAAPASSAAAKTSAQKKTAQTNSAAKNSYSSSKLYDIQLGSFSTRENAEKRARELKRAGFEDIVLQHTDEKIRVALRKIPGNKVPETEKRLKANGFTEYLVRERKE